MDEDPREWSEPPTGQSLMHPTTVNADNTTKNEDEIKNEGMDRSGTGAVAGGFGREVCPSCTGATSHAPGPGTQRASGDLAPSGLPSDSGGETDRLLASALQGAGGQW